MPHATTFEAAGAPSSLPMADVVGCCRGLMSEEREAGKPVTVGVEAPVSRHRMLPWLNAGMAYAVLTVLFTWPLVLSARSEVIGWIGDNFYYLWLVGWYRTCIQGLTNPLWVPYLNYPEGAYLACTDMTPLMSALALPGAFLGGDGLGYNSALMLSFVLAALSMHWMAWRLTGSHGAGFVAGVIYSFAPCHVVRLYGHLNLAGTFLLPPLLVAVDRLALEPRLRPRLVVVIALLAGGLALTTPYYLIMGAVMAGLWVVLRLLWREQGAPAPGEVAKRCALTALVAAPLAAIGIAPLIFLSIRGIVGERGPEEGMYWSLTPEAYFLPNQTHFLWGGLFQRLLPRQTFVEHAPYVGIVTLALALVGFVKGVPGGMAPRQTLRIFAVLAAAAFLLSLGTRLHLQGQPAGPMWLSSLLPSSILYEWLPMYGGIRVHARWSLFVLLFLSLAAAAGWAAASQRWTQRQSALGLLVVISLVVLDFLPRHEMMVGAGPRKLDIMLAAETGPGAVIKVPFKDPGEPDLPLRAAAWGRPCVGGYFGYLPPQYRRLAERLKDFPDADPVPVMRDTGARFLLLHRKSFDDPDSLRPRLESFGLQFRGQWEWEDCYEWPGPHPAAGSQPGN